MYPANSSQILSATKSFFETQLDVFNRLNMRHLESYSNLIDLNMHMMRTSLEESVKMFHALLSSRSSSELLFFAPTQSPPYAVQLIAYGKDVAEITAEMHDELYKATQVELAETGKEMSAIVALIVERETDAFKNTANLAKSSLKAMEAEQSQVIEANEKKKKAAKANGKMSTHHLSQAKKKSASHASKRSR